ncbi:MAG: hypothetical protein OXF02_04845 [Simkaniaceae bacterium]|nr:hypothetical protein [Simkaniaceae bacterium]
MASAVGVSGVCVRQSGPHEGGVPFSASAVPTPYPPTPYLPTPYPPILYLIIPASAVPLPHFTIPASAVPPPHLTIPASAVPTSLVAARTLRDAEHPAEVARDPLGERSLATLVGSKDRKELRRQVVDRMVANPDIAVKRLLPEGVPESTACRWLGEVYEKEGRVFEVPPMRRSVDRRKVLKYIREGNTATPKDWSALRRRNTTIRRGQVTSLQKQKAVDYCLQQYPKSYEVCAEDIATNPTILGKIVISSASLGIYIREAYNSHPKRREIPEHMKRGVDYRKLLLALKAHRQIPPTFSGYSLRKKCGEMTSEQEEKAVRYCMQHMGRSYKRCVRDIGKDPAILGDADISANVTDRMLGFCVQNAYERHSKTVRVPMDMKKRVDYRKLLRALWQDREVVPFSDFLKGRSAGVVATTTVVPRAPETSCGGGRVGDGDRVVSARIYRPPPA